MINLLVISDDFTGALDTGVQFSKKGIPTIISTEENLQFDLIDESIQVVVIDIETRHKSPEEASIKIKQVIQKAKESSIRYIYKKTDSTLRGNIGSELTAALEVCNSNELFFIPSYPKAGRITINGIHYIDGQLLSESIYANDPFEPIKHSSISDIIKIQSNLDVITLRGEDYETLKIVEGKQAIYVFDAQKQLDLERIGRLLKSKGKLTLTAGCAGFAEILPEVLELKCGSTESKQYKLGHLIVSGSVNETSINQVKYMENHGYEGIMLTPRQLVERDYFYSKEGGCFLLNIINKINNKEKLIIKTVNDRNDVLECMDYSRKLNIDSKKIHLVIARNIGQMIKIILDNTSIESLVVIGGDTTYGIMDELDCKWIIPKKEILLGVVSADVVSDNYNIQIITKAGGFGCDETIARIIDFLRTR